MKIFKNKKNIYISLGIVAILIIVFASFFIFSGKSTPSQNQIDTNAPFGTGGGDTSFPTEVSGEGFENTSPVNPPTGLSMWKISEIPVTGAGIFGTGTSTTIKFVEKATGHVYKYDPVSGVKERISNTTIPKTSKIVWGKGGDSLLFQYEENGSIKTYYAQIATSSATSTPSGDQGLVNGFFFEDNINNLVTSPSGNKIFYTLSGGSIFNFIISEFNGSKPLKIYSSRLKGWQNSFPNENSVSITSSPSYAAEGYSYLINLKSGLVEKTIGGKIGLTTLYSSSTKGVLYSKSVNNSFTSFLLNRENKIDLETNISTLPEKCVWGEKNSSFIYCGVPKNIPAGTYPDDWYKGKISFSDNVWIYDTNTSATESVIDPLKSVGEDIDMVEPKLSKDETLLIIRNKKDSSLWALKLDPKRIIEYVD
ncbi:MAG TPA: hypothetical protein VJC12_03135 [Candidatus Paceibacterota bacterium]